MVVNVKFFVHYVGNTKCLCAKKTKFPILISWREGVCSWSVILTQPKLRRRRRWQLHTSEQNKQVLRSGSSISANRWLTINEWIKNKKQQLVSKTWFKSFQPAICPPRYQVGDGLPGLGQWRHRLVPVLSCHGGISILWSSVSSR